MKIVAVILSGGTGSRLWPLSRELTPKQFLPLAASNQSLLQETLTRLEGVVTEKPIIVCNNEHRFIVAEQMREIRVQDPQIILEPQGKNTAPAVAVAALHALQHEDAILLVLPADHRIGNAANFHQAIAVAAEYARLDHLVTFGVTADKPETGYGYIKAGAELAQNRVFKVEKFIEKPTKEKAEEYLSTGNYFWNSGMFVFKASRYLEELAKFAPDMLDAVKRAYLDEKQDLDFIRLNPETFSQCPADSIDYAVMEHTESAVVIPISCQWNDIGSWSALWESEAQDFEGNVTIGDVILSDVKNSYLRAEDRMLVGVGLEDMVVVETPDAILVTHKNKSQQVKKIVEQLKQHKRTEAHSHKRVYRPWGSYETLVEGKKYKVKRITVNPGASLSLQSHHHRSEHWVVVTGVAEVTNGENVFTLKHDESTYIPAQTKHRLRNPGNILLELIEVQSGEYLGEDDIIRYEDIYGRVKAAESVVG